MRAGGKEHKAGEQALRLGAAAARRRQSRTAFIQLGYTAAERAGATPRAESELERGQAARAAGGPLQSYSP
jgi:hypothetical protein